MAGATAPEAARRGAWELGGGCGVCVSLCVCMHVCVHVCVYVCVCGVYGGIECGVCVNGGGGGVGGCCGMCGVCVVCVYHRTRLLALGIIPPCQASP